MKGRNATIESALPDKAICGGKDSSAQFGAKSRSEAIRLVKVAFDDADIEMPEPIYRVHLQEPGQRSHHEEKPEMIKIDAEEDVSVDDTIDRQVEAVRDLESEGNLLEEESQ